MSAHRKKNKKVVVSFAVEPELKKKLQKLDNYTIWIGNIVRQALPTIK